MVFYHLQMHVLLEREVPLYIRGENGQARPLYNGTPCFKEVKNMRFYSFTYD